MRFTKQLIAGAAMAAIGAMATAQPATGMGNDTKTRAQVRAETAAAMAAGQMVSAGEAENYPFRLTEVASTRSRAQVEAEAAAAVAAGETPRGELSLAELQPQPVTSEKTHTQVQAETLEARRLGLLTPAGELGVPEATSVQRDMIRVVGLRARDGASMHAAR